MIAIFTRRSLVVGFFVSLTCAVSAANATCSPASPWPLNAVPNVSQLALAAQRDAASDEDATPGKAAAQWLLGSLYLYGLGVPEDRATAIEWIKAAARTARAA